MIFPEGFRCEQVYVVTALLDPVAYPAAALAQLYRQRWQAELDLRAIKQGLGGKLLRCRAPARHTSSRPRRYRPAAHR